MAKITVEKKEEIKDDKGRVSARFTRVHATVGNKKVVVSVPIKVAKDNKKLMEALEFSVGGQGMKKARDERAQLRALALSKKSTKKEKK